MWRKKNEAHLDEGLEYLENFRYSEAIASFRKQIKEDADSAKALFHLKSTMHHLNPSYSWECEACKNSQTSTVFPSTDSMATFMVALHSDLWGEVVDSSKKENCVNCGKESSVVLTLCENCYEDYLPTVTFSQKGSGMVAMSMSTRMPICPKCGYRPQSKKNKSSKLQKRYSELLKLYPEVKDMIDNLRSSGLLKT